MARGRSGCTSGPQCLLGMLGLLVCAAIAPPAAALDVGLQSAGDGVSKQVCSRTCESDHCTTPPFLRYGKYCGILYSGCPGEPPCDALDACCMHHDNCVQAKNDYLSTQCNEDLLECLGKLRESTSTFEGNKCMIDEVIDVISLVIEAAVIAGRVLHKP
ncbi:phospholipase A2 homolog 3-like isoform X2 [Phragmites australis]|uniref:phospholipase A2 homolog 3-like isoform X2 n=1 Tax=Phragmites australis TaxID=29695 RepID=UPI002D799F7E|nr:phospholipase A2 homolog 3-like isoform X2 [Phragmites australis]